MVLCLPVLRFDAVLNQVGCDDLKDGKLDWCDIQVGKRIVESCEVIKYTRRRLKPIWSVRMLRVVNSSVFFARLGS